MKKKILLLLFICLLLFGCKEKVIDNKLPQGDTNPEVSNTPEVSIPSNSHTISFTFDNTKDGYNWECLSEENNTSLVLASKEIVFDKTVLTFNSFSKGNINLLMMYENNTETLYQIEYQVSIDDNLNIKVVNSLGAIDGIKPAEPEIN